MKDRERQDHIQGTDTLAAKQAHLSDEGPKCHRLRPEWKGDDSDRGQRDVAYTVAIFVAIVEQQLVVDLESH